MSKHVNFGAFIATVSVAPGAVSVVFFDPARDVSAGIGVRADEARELAAMIVEAAEAAERLQREHSTEEKPSELLARTQARVAYAIAVARELPDSQTVGNA